MSEKRELIDIASQLQSIVDRLLECAKEDKKEDDEDEPKPSFNKVGMIALSLKKKLGKY